MTIDAFQTTGTSPPEVSPMNIIDVPDDVDLLCRVVCRGKIHHFTQDEVRSHVFSLKTEGYSDAYYYECSCECWYFETLDERAHWHVASSPVPRRLRGDVA